MNKALLTFLGGFFFISFSHGQKSDFEKIAQSYLAQHYSNWQLSRADVENYEISNFYTEETGITHLYLQQEFNEVLIENAIIGLHINALNEVYYATNNFVSNSANKVNVAQPEINAEEALRKSMEALNLNAPNKVNEKRVKKHQVIFSKTNQVEQDVQVNLVYYNDVVNNMLKLAWRVYIIPNNGSDYWYYYINALTGEVLKAQSLTVHCSFDDAPFSRPKAFDTPKEMSPPMAPAPPEEENDGSTYRVFKVPTESPNHGPHELVTEPSDDFFSPHGWHDVNNSPGAEYTITRGNNVHAFQSRPDNSSSLGDEPDGGNSLYFDFPYNSNLSSEEFLDAAVVNLFYMNNIMHDVSAKYGFTPSAGNFQQNTYGMGGIGNDPVRARAQSGADIGNANNANMSTPADGSQPTMNMYIWTSVGGLVTVNAPEDVEGVYETSGSNTINSTDPWGAQITSSPVTGEVEIVQDNAANPSFTDGCETLQNTTLNNKIALVDRGGCEFGFKAYQVQQKGAKGCIICNFEDDLVGLGGGAYGSQVNIPVVMMKKSDCDLIRQYAGSGLEVSFVDLGEPDTLDSDFDNGIIAHEYAHGISNRLTGGPTQASCLVNAEQMGEGWSDFFGLAYTVQPGDNGAMSRGVGTYAINENPNGIGIRRYPYSTDMDVNPLTYGDVALNTEVHALGEVWTAVLWDLYWKMTETYGWDEDLYDGTGGNNMAIKLVMEGMKLQPCSPGFLDGRDAIIAADQQLYGGANTCLIQEVFARRGMGLSASQGSSQNATDQVEAFDTNPLCIAELKIQKTVTEIIDAGDVIDVTLLVQNHTGSTKPGVIAVDTIPSGATYVNGSANIAPTQNGNILEFNIGDMAFEDEVSITYQLATDPNIWSTPLFRDEVDDDSYNLWESVFVSGGGFYEWIQSVDQVQSAPYSWFSGDVGEDSKQTIKMIDPVTISGDQPVLKFWHYYNTQAIFDGGTVDISTDGQQWSTLGDMMFKNPYVGEIDYQTFVTPNVEGFYGSSGGWVPTYVDLSSYAGQDVYIRFRLGTFDEIGGDGWYVDDIEVMDLRNYYTGACAVSTDGTTACDMPENRGSLLETNPGEVVSVKTIDHSLPFMFFPNPATEQVNIQFFEQMQNVEITILSVDGKRIEQTRVSLEAGASSIIDISGYAPGTYYMQVNTQNKVFTEKFVKQ